MCTEIEQMKQDNLDQDRQLSKVKKMLNQQIKEKAISKKQTQSNKLSNLIFMAKMMMNLQAQAATAKGKISTNSEIYEFDEEF